MKRVLVDTWSAIDRGFKWRQIRFEINVRVARQSRKNTCEQHVGSNTTMAISDKQLIVKLFVGDVLVEQSSDVSLWQRVLSEIKGVSLAPGEQQPEVPSLANPSRTVRTKSHLAEFAKAIGVSEEELVGALDPQINAPYISLDERSWEALKKNTPSRGQGSVSQTVLAATALVLWQKYQEIGDVSVSAIKAVMSTIDLDDPNVNRSISNCDWLQPKGSRIVLNPSRRAAALRILRAYCKREPLSAED